MASPGSVVVQFLSDVKDAAQDAAKYAQSLGKVEDAADDADRPLSTLERAMDDVGTTARTNARLLDSTETSYDQVGDEAERAADRIRASAREMAAGVRAGADDIEDETSGMKQSLGDAGRESGAEFVGNLAEGIGSGQASVNDVLQGTLGGLTNLARRLD